MGEAFAYKHSNSMFIRMLVSCIVHISVLIDSQSAEALIGQAKNALLLRVLRILLSQLENTTNYGEYWGTQCAEHHSWELSNFLSRAHVRMHCRGQPYLPSTQYTCCCSEQCSANVALTCTSGMKARQFIYLNSIHLWFHQNSLYQGWI